MKTPDRDWTWQVLSEAVSQRAQIWRSQGVGEGSVVAMISANHSEFLLQLLSLWQCGAQALLLNPKLSTQEQEKYLAHWAVDAVWQEGQALKIHSPKPITQAVEWQADRRVTLILTSGSTGFPKAVVHQAKHHLASADGLLQKMAFEETDAWLLSLPLFHVSGMGIVWRWLLKGAQLVIPKSASDVLPLLSRVTHASLVPTQLQRWLATEPKSHQLKRVLLGGATIPVALTNQAEAQGIACWCGYGMTEMASTVTAKRADGKMGVGQTLPNRSLRLQDGQIFVQGESLAEGYYQPDGQVVSLKNADGWFATKDLAQWQDDEWVILGRADNMFISGGENIQPEEIEKILLEHTEITQAFVLPKKDAEFGAKPVAILQTLVPMSDAWLADLKTWLMPRLMKFKQPIAYFALPDDLTNGGIKIPRAKVQTWFDAQ